MIKISNILSCSKRPPTQMNNRKVEPAKSKDAENGKVISNTNNVQVLKKNNKEEASMCISILNILAFILLLLIILLTNIAIWVLIAY